MVSKVIRLLYPVGLAALLLPAFRNVSAAPSSSSAVEECYNVDGSLADDFSYFQCPGSNACCPMGSICSDNGLCIKPLGEYNILIRGACKSKDSDSLDCPITCAASLPDTAAYLNPCSAGRFCCGSSLKDQCCGSGTFLIEGAEAIMFKSPYEEEDEEEHASRKPFTSKDFYSKQPTTVGTTETVAATTTVTGTATTQPIEESEEIDKHDATKFVGIGVGLGVGGALVVVAAVVLFCWHFRKQKRRKAELAEVAAKSVAGSEGLGASTVNTPVENPQMAAFAVHSRTTDQLDQAPGYHSYPPPQPPRSVSPMPPAPPYSPPQYDGGDYQFLVLDGPAPSHPSNGPGSAGGGLPVGDDGKPRLES